MYDAQEESYRGEKEEEEETDTELEEELWKPQYRPAPPQLPQEERRQSFRETELCFSEAEALYESNRCLRCDLEK